jgi:phosphoribosylglycinamide formyltransferase-1
VLCSGNGSNLQALLDAERSGKLGAARITLVVSDRADAFALARANKAGKPAAFLDPKDFADRAAFDAALLGVLKKAGIDIVVLAGFMRILTAGFVDAYKGRMLNVHPSLLPAFKGAHAIRDAVEYGVRVTGVTVHFVTPELDGGPLVLQEAVEVRAGDTIDSLAKRIHAVEHRLYPRAVRLLAEGRVAVKGRQVLVR